MRKSPGTSTRTAWATIAQEAAAVKKRYSYQEGERPFEWTRLDGPEEKTRDGITARKIAQLMEEKTKEGKPFFLAAGFHKPHLPWTAPAKYFDLYPVERIPKPQDPPLKDIPAIALMTELTGNPAPQSRTEAMAAYYACISFMDAQVGVLLETLDRLKLWDNTIVLLFQRSRLPSGGPQRTVGQAHELRTGGAVPCSSRRLAMGRGKPARASSNSWTSTPRWRNSVRWRNPPGWKGKAWCRS